MKAYVINLDRAPDRWSFTQTQGARLDLDLIRIPATDGASLPPADLSITAYERACFLSHARAWAEIAAGSASHAAVFEDDVLLARDTATFLTPDWLPPDADLVKLTASTRRVKLRQTAQPAPYGRALHRLTAPTIDSAGYIISAAHARRLTATTPTLSRALDRELFDTAGATIYQLTPAIAVQQKFTDTAFLPETARASQIQSKRARPPLDLSLTKLRDELRNLYRKKIFPRILPALTLVTPPDRRILHTTIPFAEGPLP